MKQGRRRWTQAGLCALAFAITLAAGAPARAADAPDVKVQITAQREIVTITEDGEKEIRLEPAGSVQAGDVIVYTLLAHNVGNAPAFNARLQDPIPDGTVLIPDSVPVEGTPVEASVDNGSSWQSFPARVKQRAANGAMQDGPAPASSYTHLRWVLPGQLDPGDRREVSFKVEIQ